MNKEVQYDVFLSYRRDGGEMLAKLLHDKMQDKGLRVFLDVESLRSGLFNTKLLDVIAQSRDFVLILPPNALDRCKNENDWLRLEIEHAIKLKKNIIPVTMRGFSWPSDLPKSISSLHLYNGVSASHEYFDAAVEKLISMMQTKSRSKKKPNRGLHFAILTAAVAVVCALLFAFGVIQVKPAYYSFKDNGVEALVRNALSKEEGGITQAELDTIKQLPGIQLWKGTDAMTDSYWMESDMDLEDDIYDIAVLDDLAHMPSLERLNLSWQTDVIDLSPLGKLTKLTLLDISEVGDFDTPINLDALANLKELTLLNLSDCELTDIGFLSALSNLRTLDLMNNEIADTAPLASLAKLRELTLANNNITDISPLAGCVALQRLSLSSNKLTDISPLAGATDLRWLNLSSCGLESLDTLPAFPALVEIDLSSNRLGNIDALAGLQTLQDVSLAYNLPLDDITPLLGLPNLTELSFSQNFRYTSFEQLLQLEDKGCYVHIAETNQSEALQRYRDGTYLKMPKLNLKNDTETAAAEDNRYIPHGVAMISMTNGKVLAAVGNSMVLFASSTDADMGINLGTRRIMFSEMSRMTVDITDEARLLVTCTLRDGSEPISELLAESVDGLSRKLCFIDENGMATYIDIIDSMDIQFDWTKVPELELHYLLVESGNAAVLTVPQNVRLVYTIKESYTFDQIISSELPIVDGMFAPFDAVKSAVLRKTLNGEVQITFSTDYTPENTTTTLISELPGDENDYFDRSKTYTGYQLYVLGADGLETFSMTQQINLTRVQDDTPAL